MKFKGRWFFFLLLPLLIGFFYVSTKPSEVEIHECDNIFSSGVYAHFCGELRKVLKENDLLTLAPQKCSREEHERFVVALRNLLLENEKKSEADQITQWLYSDLSLTKPMYNYLAEKGFLPNSDDLLTDIKNTNLKIHADGRFKNLFGLPKIDDPFLHGNLPSFLFAMESCKVIRLPNPAKDLTFFERFFLPSEKGVEEEFRRHIENLANLNKKHLYVNLMKRKGIEWPKTKLLEEFEAFSPGLVLITLDKDSNFYLQNSGEEQSLKEFKKVFLKELFQPKGNYYWSKKLDHLEWKEKCRIFIDETAQRYFSGKLLLTQNERRDFIELTYLKIIRELQKQFRPEIMNISCKQSMDRGPSLYTLLYADYQLEKEVSLSEIRENIITWLFAPPLLVHNRPSHHSRIERFVSALRRRSLLD